MAFDKKPSMYSNRGTIGSAEELDAYGVWVKSEPQDLAAGLAGAMDFGTAGFDNGGFGAAGYRTADFGAAGFGASFGNGFNGGYGDYDIPDVDISSIETETPEIGIEEFKISSFDDEITAETAQSVPEDKSTRLLMKIADELSSIRSELTTLKTEFADIRCGAGQEEAKQDDIFTKEDEISSTDSEIENLAAAFSDDMAFDPLRDEDEAALRKLSGEKDDSAGEETAAPGDIEIDFDNLGIDLDETAVGGSDSGETDGDSFFDDFDLPSVETAVDFGLSELPENYTIADPLDELDELRDLRLEGAASMAEVPENNVYLEEDPFPLQNGGFDNLALDEASLNINLDDFAIETPAPLEELEIETSFDIPQFDEQPLFADSALNIDLSGAVTDEPDLSGTGLTEDDEPIQAEAEDPGIARDIPEAFEENIDEPIDETMLSFDDELELPETELSVSETETEAETANEIMVAEQAVEKAGSGISPGMKTELKSVLSYMDGLLESLPEEKIEEFAKSEYFDTYKKLFKDLGLV